MTVRIIQTIWISGLRGLQKTVTVTPCSANFSTQSSLANLKCYATVIVSGTSVSCLQDELREVEEESTLAEVIRRNTDVGDELSDNVFIVE